MLEDFKKRFDQHIRLLQDQITQKMKNLDVDLKIEEDLCTRLDHIGADGGWGRARG